MILFEWPILYELTADVEHYRYERCGFLLGREKGENQIINRIMPVPNVRHLDKHVTYEISTSAYLHAEDEAERTASILMGVYHSHPNQTAIPSAFDWAAAQPNFIYAIISVMNKKISGFRVWQLNECNLFEEKIYDFTASSRTNSTVNKLSSCDTE